MTVQRSERNPLADYFSTFRTIKLEVSLENLMTHTDLTQRHDHSLNDCEVKHLQSLSTVFVLTPSGKYLTF